MQEKFKLVKNQEKYFEFIRSLRNNPKVSQGFIEQKRVSKKEQEIYMAKYQKNYFICLCGGDPVGYIGVIDGDIRIAVLPEYQRQGIGLFMIKSVRKKYKRLIAKIKVENNASRKLFEKAGFKLKYYLYE